MKSIGVFYHCYIPDNHNSTLWHVLIDEQMGMIENSGLAKVGNINMCITMPMYWSIDHGERSRLFYNYVREYIWDRYPFVNIIEIRDTGDENIYECQTLRHLHKYSIVNPDHSVLYFHTKGITTNRLETKLWRQILDQVMVNQWQQRYLELKDVDCLGISYRNTENDIQVFSGNYFWADCKYVASLREPPIEDRYYYELWIHENEPKRKFIMDLSDKNMYDDIHIYGKLT
jgi:transposase-like protein